MTTRVLNLAIFAAAALLAGASAAADSQTPPGPIPAIGIPNGPTYADLADLALAAPVVAHVRVAGAIPLKGAQAAGVPAGQARFYVEAEIVSLILGAEGLPAKVRYLLDLPLAAGGKVPKLRKGAEFILFARPVAGRIGDLQLTAPDAHVPYTPARAEQVRAVLRESSAPGAAPRITGIGRAFHVPGAIHGESETQIFLLTEANEPVSITVLRRPGETPQWAVALSEIVDDAAEPPQRDTLLWYRLACTLPRTLPAQSLAEADAAGAAAIQADYRLVVDRLGTCARTRARR